MLNFNILANIEADNRLQKTAYLKKKKKKKRWLDPTENKLFNKTDEFSEGGLCDSWEIFRVP